MSHEDDKIGFKILNVDEAFRRGEIKNPKCVLETGIKQLPMRAQMSM